MDEATKKGGRTAQKHAASRSTHQPHISSTLFGYSVIDTQNSGKGCMRGKKKSRGTTPDSAQVKPVTKWNVTDSPAKVRKISQRAKKSADFYDTFATFLSEAHTFCTALVASSGVTLI